MNKYLFESDYSADSLRWIRKREELKIINHPFSKKNLEDVPELDALQEEIIKANDSALSYFFAMEYPYKTYKMQKVILDNKDAKYAFLFAQNIRNCDIKALQRLVIDSKKTKYICKFG